MSKRNLLGIVGIILLIAAVFGVTKSLQRQGDKQLGADETVIASDKTDSSKVTVMKTNFSCVGEKAIKESAARNRYVFVTFYKQDDAAGKKMLVALKKSEEKLADKADFVTIDFDDELNRELISYYEVEEKYLPLTLVLAPNGAITAGFPNELKDSDFSEVFVSDGTLRILKVLQSGKMTIVTVRNDKTKSNRESMEAARSLHEDPKYADNSEIVEIDSSVKEESGILEKLGVPSSSTESQIVLIVPPGRVIGRFEGAVTSSELDESLQNSFRSCGSDCGPGGCR